MMVFRHVLRTFASKKATLLLLGIVVMLSSFVFTILYLGASSVETSSEVFFEDYIQEEFVIETTPLITEIERMALAPDCPVVSQTVFQLYHEDKDCFYELLDFRLSLLEDLEDYTLEPRLYKDGEIGGFEKSHRVRVLKDARIMNLTYLDSGALPETENEIAILSHYADHNALSIGDTLDVDGSDYIITGFVLFPDYNLPVFDHPFIFTTSTQTLALMSDAGFDAYERRAGFYYSGLFGVARFTPEDFLEEHADIAPFIHHMSLTENNMRSGAIYAEIEGSYAAAVSISVLIAFIGIVIVGLMMKKTVEQTQRPLGILKALGLKNREMMMPYLVFITVFSFVFLLLGYGIGFYSAPWMRDLYLAFYLLPRGPIPISAFSFIVAFIVPFFILVAMSLVIVFRLLSRDSLTLMNPRIELPRIVRFRSLKRLSKKFPFFLRFQFAFLSRHMLKAFIYALGVFFAVYVSFLSLGMEGVFDDTVHAYYESTEIVSVGYGPTGENNGHTRVIELQGNLGGEGAFVVGLPDGQTIHPLFDEAGESLLGDLEDGIVLSRSFALISGFSVGDNLALRIGGVEETVLVTGIADIHPGEHVFTSREYIGETFFEDPGFHNAVYARVALSEDDFDEVFVIENLLSQVEEINEVMMQMFYVMIGAGLLIGAIIIYLLTVLTVEDHFYNIALFKMIGYHDKEIHKMLLGGYSKLNVLIFLLVIPFSLMTFDLMTTFFAQEYNFVMPLGLDWPHVFLIAILYGMIYMLASRHAKKKINKVSLQAALQIYQV